MILFYYSFVEEEISKFISEMTCTGSTLGTESTEKGSETKNSSTNWERLKSYQLFTPLNNKVLPDLLKYLQLLREREDGSADASTLFGNRSSVILQNVEDMKPDTLLEMDWQELWALSSTNPGRLCEKLLDAVKIPLSVLEDAKAGKQISLTFLHPDLIQREEDFAKAGNGSGGNSPNDVDDSEDNNSDDEKARTSDNSNNNNSISATEKDGRHKPELYEIICSLLFEWRADLLPYFVTAVSQVTAASSLQFVQGVPAKKSYFAERALLAIPTISADLSLPASHVKICKTLPKEKVVVLARLLAMSHQRLTAMLFVLRADLWEAALELLRGAATAESRELQQEAAELFVVALYDCMEKKKTDRLDQLWDYIPPSMSPLDIVHAVSVFIEQHPAAEPASKRSVIVDPKEHLTVETFQKVLMKVIEKKKEN